MNSVLKKLAVPLIVLVLSYGAIKPLFVPGFFPMHDDTQPARVYEMAQSLLSGQFPVRWVGELGYGFGYPIFNFYAPLPYYIGALFNISGLDVISSTKIMFAVGILISSLSMYLLVQELAGPLAGIVASILYLYAPYHAVNIYVRGAVGEFYAYGFLPLVLWGVAKIMKPYFNDIKSGIIIGSIGYAAVLLSHNILGLITLYLLVSGLIIYALFLILKKQNKLILYYLSIIILLGFGLSSFFIIPALAESKYTKVSELTTGGSDFHHHFIFLDQLWNSPWGYGGSAGRESGMSFKIGKVHLLAGLVSFLYIFYLYKFKKDRSLPFKIISPQLIILFLSVFFMLEQSSFLWEKIPGFPFIQYPWRFINLSLFSLSVLTAFLFLKQPQSLKILLTVIIIGANLWYNLKYFTPQTYLSSTDQDYTGSFNIRYKISKISDEYLPPDFIAPKKPEQVALHGISNTSNIQVRRIISEYPTFKKYQIFALNKQEVTSAIAFFPGWQGYIDGSQIQLEKNQGRIAITVPAGSHIIEFRLTDTPIRTVSNTISILSLFLLVYVTLSTKNKFLWPKNIQSK